MTSTTSAPLSRPAVVSLVLGLLALPLQAATGIPALILGLRGLRQVNQSDGRFRGRRLAIAGLVLGGLGVLETMFLFGWLVIMRVNNASRLAQCANNFRQDGLAVSRYYDDSGSRRGGAFFPPGTVINADLKPDQRLSWMVLLLPFLDRPEGAKESPWQQLADKIDLKKGWDAEANAAARTSSVPLFLCPAQRVFDPRTQPGLTTYVGVAGINPNAAQLAKDNLRAGFFGYERRINRENVTAGISSTMMALETGVDNGPWCAGGAPTVRGMDPDENVYIGPGRPFGGFHPGGLNVLWVDGHVSFVSEKVNPDLFRSWSTLQRQDEK